MIEQLESKLKELEIKKLELQPKIDKIEEKKAEEILELNKKYDHMIQDVNVEVEAFEQKIMDDLIDLFSKIIMDEFEQKRSTSEYSLTDNFKQFRDAISEIEFFPKDLVGRLDKVLEGDLIENVAYDLQKIESEYKRL
jgi:galactose-1-phosphate uridylyltransferase